MNPKIDISHTELAEATKELNRVNAALGDGWFSDYLSEISSQDSDASDNE